MHGLLLHLRFWLLCLLGFFVLTLITYFLFSPTFTIRSIRVSREDRRVDVEEIQTLLSPTFGNHILFVSPLLIAREIQSAFPEISSVQVRRSFPDELQILLSMDEISATVEIGKPDDTEASAPEEIAAGSGSGAASQDLHRYVTKQGVYLEYPFPLPDQNEERRLPLHLVDWAVKPAHRQALFTPLVLETMTQARSILEQSFGNSIASITVYVRAREFHVKTVHPGRPEGKEAIVLWFDLASSLPEQIERYREFLRSETLDAAEEYVDLRLHDRVVFR